MPLDLSKTTSDQFGKYRDWNGVLNANGPFDEPSFCFETGIIFMQNSYLDQPLPLNRQAVAPFDRVRELEPDNLDARLWLGQIYVMSRLPDRALDALRDPLEHPERFSLAKTNKTRLNIIAAAAYFQKNDLARGNAIARNRNRPPSRRHQSAQHRRAGLSGAWPVHQRAGLH